jgi:hypothetical protein
MQLYEVKDSVVYKHLQGVTESGDYMTPVMFMDSGVKRKEGLHLTQVTGDLYLELNKKEPDSSTPASDCADPNVRMSMGFAWEYILSRAIEKVFPNERIVSLDELYGEPHIIYDGVMMSPDRIDIGDPSGELVVEEWKCTWKSARGPDEDFDVWAWTWLMQVKAYCLALHTTRCRFRILFINGDYSRGKGQRGRCSHGPCVRTFELKFTEEELQENWQMIRSRAKQKGWL